MLNVDLICIHTHIHTHTYIYIYIERQKKKTKIVNSCIHSVKIRFGLMFNTNINTHTQNDVDAIPPFFPVHI